MVNPTLHQIAEFLGLSFPPLCSPVRLTQVVDIFLEAPGITGKPPILSCKISRDNLKAEIWDLVKIEIILYRFGHLSGFYFPIFYFRFLSHICCVFISTVLRESQNSQMLLYLQLGFYSNQLCHTSKTLVKFNYIIREILW